MLYVTYITFVVMFESYLRRQLACKGKYELNSYCNAKQGQIASILNQFQYGPAYCIDYAWKIL